MVYPGTCEPRHLTPLSIGDPTHLARIYAHRAERFASYEGMVAWLSGNGIDCQRANSKKGLRKLFEKIHKGEARLLNDERSGCVVRPARVAKLNVEATIKGERYPLVELCQVFLVDKIAEELLFIDDPLKVPEVLSKLKIRAAQVRNTVQLWETLFSEEDARAGALRGLVEELGLLPNEAETAELTLSEPKLEYEAPIDWPGIHSVLEIHEATVILPEVISKPVFVEVEGGDQITIFIATPNAPVLRALFQAVIPNLHWVSPSDS